MDINLNQNPENLERIQKDIDNLKQMWKEAHHYQSQDPSSSLVKARVTAEEICQRLFLEQREKSPEEKVWKYRIDKLCLGDFASRLHEHKVIPRVISTALFVIQKFGNMGAHALGDERDHIDGQLIEPCLSALTSVVQWYLETHCDERLNRKLTAHKVQDNSVVQIQKLISETEVVANGLEQILLAAIHQIRGMQITTKNFFLRRSHTAKPHPLRDELDYSKKRNLFHLDNGDEVDGFEIEEIGNITGKGGLEERSDEFWMEVDMALSLTTTFQITRSVLSKVVWVYYTSAQQFIYIAPWTSYKGSDHSYSPTLLTLEFFTAGLPENNCNRTIFWTKPYCDEYGEGMMVTLGAPVDREGQFLGTVALDLSVDLFNSHLRLNDNALGTLILVNEHGQVLGHPYKTSSDDTEVRQFTELISGESEIFSAIDLAAWEPRTAYRVDTRSIFFVPVENTSWRLYFVSK